MLLRYRIFRQTCLPRINFDMPGNTAEEYVHRVGRTGRAGNKGDAISLVGPKDWDSFKRVELYLQQDLTFSVLEGLKGKFKKALSLVNLLLLKAHYKKKTNTQVKKTPVKNRLSDKPPPNVAASDTVFIPKKKVAPKVDDE
ncbi:hypothetical protein O9993_17115 [Vibrio lentus]|nr:hypothetical protein [Vibrio lentus]